MPPAAAQPGGTVELSIEGPLDRHTVPEWHRRLAPKVRAGRGGTVRLDLGGVTSMDSAGAAFCAVVQRRAERGGAQLRLGAVSSAAREALEMFRVRIEADEAPVAEGWAERVGAAVYRAYEGFIHFAALVTDTFHFTILGIFTRRHRIRGRATVEQMVRIGLQSAGIVALLSLLVGLVVALQSAAQLRQFGANIYIANLVGVAMTREMGPLMTAIIVAGRVGASIAAEISTMVITEEVDALRTMGMHPVRFLVVPRFLAISFTQPLLTTISNVMGILGGFFIAVTYLQLGGGMFVDQLLNAMVLKDVMTGLVKSVSFAWIILFVGVHRGFRVHGGAEGVGLATTNSVVQAIFLVIVADAFFSLIFYFGG